MSGIIHQGSIQMVSSVSNGSWLIADAINQAVSFTAPGDVILLEQQEWSTAISNYCPVEVRADIYSAIANATALNRIIVEPAGNGSNDLDNAVWGGIFQRATRDSGALMIGAGTCTNRSRCSFSNYGSRLDIQGWGDWSVATLAYGDLYGTAATNYYTRTFAGTSSGSALSAAIAAAIQSYARANYGFYLPPLMLRSNLVQSGYAQTFGPAGNIGPLPNLSNAFIAVDNLAMVTPWDGIDAQGSYGGPFNPSNKVYVLTNAGPGIVAWTVANTQGWVNVSTSAVTLAPWSSTQIVVSISAVAGALSPGQYGSLIAFFNVTAGVLQTRAVTLTVTQANQSITFTNPGNQVITNTVGLSATASSGLPVTFTVGSGPGNITGFTNLTFIGSGLVSIVASQSGNVNWNPAPNLTNTFNVSKLVQAPLVFNPMSPQIFNTTNPLTVTGGSGAGAVTYVVQSGPGQIVGGTNLWVTSGTGIVVVVADKATDPIYEAASATGQVVAAQASQFITFAVIVNQIATNTVGLNATASSGLPVNYMVGSGPGLIAGTNLTFSGSGAVSVVASQAGDANWSAAPSLTNIFNVTKAPAQVALLNLSQTYNGAPRVVTASSVPSGLSVLLTYDGIVAAPINAGSYAVIGTINEAQYEGLTNGTLVVAKGNQTITFPAIPDQIVTSRVTLAATASSGLPVQFAVVSGPAEILTASILTFTGTGVVTVAAAQLGDGNWNAASAEASTFNVLPAISPIAGITDADFDGDRLADPSIYDERTGTWTVKMSGSGYATLTLSGLLGGPGYKVAVGDYDGDMISDPTVFQEATGNWILMQSGSGYVRLDLTALLGAPGWAPASANYVGSDIMEFAVYQEATANWTVKLGSSAGALELYFYNLLGGPGYSAVSADFDGDGYADPAVYNRTDGTWKMLLSVAGYLPLTLPSFLGGAGWNAVPGDYDGDRLSDPAVRKSDGSEWRIMLSGSGYALISVPIGL